MSEPIEGIADNGDRSSSTASSFSASERMFEEVRQSRAVGQSQPVGQFQRHTDLSGNPCESSPAAGEVPILEIGVETSGCTFRDGTRGPGREASSEPIEFNTSALYQQALGENVRINIGGRVNNRPEQTGGSGVVIGRDGQRCVIATNSHVVSPQNMQVQSRQVEMPNGRSYPARVAINEPGTDRAAIVINTGRDTDEICRPAQVAAASGRPGPGWATGFPLNSTSLYVSPLETNGMSRSNLNRGNDGRVLLTATHNSGHVERGNSGGPIYNAQGEVLGLVALRGREDGSGEHLRVTIGTTFDQNIQQKWMARISNE